MQSPTSTTKLARVRLPSPIVAIGRAIVTKPASATAAPATVSVWAMPITKSASIGGPRWSHVRPKPLKDRSKSKIHLIGNPHCAFSVAIIDAAGSVIVVGREPADHGPAALAAERAHGGNQPIGDTAAAEGRIDE